MLRRDQVTTRWTHSARSKFRGQRRSSRGLGWVRAIVLLQRIADLRPGEGAKVLAAGAWFCALMTANGALRPLRDSMAVAGGVNDLHWLFTATFLVMLAAVPIYGLAVARCGRARLVPVVHRFFALNLLGFFVVMHGLVGGESDAVATWTARVFFVWTSVFNLFVISLFWSVLADLFSGQDARRLFGLIGVGGSIGAIAGPAIGGAVALWVSPSWLPLIAALLLELSLVAMRRMGREPSEAPASPVPDDPVPDDPIGGRAFAAIPELLRSPLLLGICAYVLLLTMSSTVLYFMQAQIVAVSFTDEGTRTAVFAGVDLSVNALTLAIQALLTGRLIQRIGLSWSLATLPLLCALGFACLAIAPVLLVLLGLQILRRVASYAVSRPAREVLYTMVDRSQRYKAKSLIDTVVYRGGDALTGWAFTGIKALGLGLGGIALVMAPVAGLWAGVGALLGRDQKST
ncbi:Major facilitator superfamily MFS_1 [Enhygromyxa salina]|uniref:Major facilitator superfamily MFS_1 n=1 Tax=Enhygromyxa salina TaxID=215803 RepID=A0A0C2CYB3_9BACT|nr:MFS transporter [Enhygromyxa salina]KIG15981.1 Major facilitator superfamily MFS_1 [Enhygromyxa salina]